MKSSTPSTAPFPGRSAAIFSVLCFGGLSAALMQSLVIPIQGSLPHLLAASPSTASWVLTATLLSAGVAVGGRLADIHGKKPVLVGTAAMLLLGSVLCALAPSVTLMLTGRVLQGFAMGYIPVAISAVRQVVPVHLSNTAVAGVSATLGVGGALGLPLAAWIAQVSDWHNLFWVSAALGAVVMVLSLTVVPDLQDAHPGKLDVVGIVGLAVGLLGVLVGFSKGNEWGWGSPLTLVMLVGGAVVLLLWGWYELGRDEPLVDLRTTARAPVLFTDIAAVLIGFGMMAQSVVVPQLLELPTATGHGLGQSILQAGLWMAPGGLVMMLFTPISSRLLNALGGRITLAVGGRRTGRRLRDRGVHDQRAVAAHGRVLRGQRGRGYRLRRDTHPDPAQRPRGGGLRGGGTQQPHALGGHHRCRGRHGPGAHQQHAGTGGGCGSGAHRGRVPAVLLHRRAGGARGHGYRPADPAGRTRR
nr:MFS transporter [Kocuria sp. cx-116]